MSELEPEPTTAEAVATEPEAPEAPAEPSWSGPSQEEWEQTQSALEYFSSLMQPVVPQQPQGPEPLTAPDPFADDYPQQLAQYVEQMIEQRTAPIAGYVQETQRSEGEKLSKDVLSDLSSRDGEFDIDRAYEIGLARYREQAAMNPTAQTWEALEKTMAQAAAEVREYEHKVAEAAVERYKNELAGLGGRRPDLPAGGANGASQQFTVTPGGTELDLAYKYGQGR